MRSSWGQLFTLGLAQCAYTLSLPSILTSIINHLQASIAQEKITASKVKLITEHICRLQDCVSSLHKMQVDSTEYAYLKALTLFSAGKFDYQFLLSSQQFNLICSLSDTWNTVSRHIIFRYLY